MSDRNDSSTRLFTEAPHDGSRHPKFRRFKRDLLAGADSIFLTEDDWSVGSGLLDLDQGGLKDRHLAVEPSISIRR